MESESFTSSPWKERSSKIWCFYCPLCKSPRRIPFRPEPGGFFHGFQVALSSCVFTAVFWKVFHLKGLVSFVPFWMVFEVVYRWRTRAALSCPGCGFDPYLFLSDLKTAQQEIQAHWKKKFAEKGIPYPEKKSEKSRSVLPPSPPKL
ncbi:MAG: hypothetical protein ACO3A2_06110 [Bdellovibrionia bacterium]